MLVAHDIDAGDDVEATRDLPDSDYCCPACDEPVILKRGRVKVAHFAHRPGAECWTEPESPSHLRAKQILAERFRAIGYDVIVEEVHRRHERRVDVAATVYSPNGKFRVAVEVQDSAISVEEMKHRTRVDKRLGFFGTTWVFTDRRARALLSLPSEIEVRVPREMLWVDNRYGRGLFVLELDAEAMWNLHLFPVVERESETEYDTYYYRPKTLRHVVRRPAGFRLTCRRGKFGNEWAVIFAP